MINSPNIGQKIPPVSDSSPSISKMIPPPSNALLTMYGRTGSTASVFFAKLIGVIVITGLPIFLFGAVDIWLKENDLKLTMMLIGGGLFSGLFGWMFLYVAKESQRERELKKWIYLSITPDDIIYQFYDQGIQRIVIPRHRFLEMAFSTESSGMDDSHTPIMGLKYFLPDGEERSLDIDYFFPVDLGEWDKMEKLLSPRERGLSIKVSPQEIIYEYEYLEKDQGQVYSTRILRDWIIKIENSEPDGDPGKPVKIWYRQPDGELRVMSVDYQFVYEGLTDALQDKVNTVVFDFGKKVYEVDDWGENDI